MLETEIMNSTGDGRIILTDYEEARVMQLQNQANELTNALGYEINITSLTAISKKVVEQKFFTIPPADYMPIIVGEGAWSAEITTYRDFSTSGDFEKGNLNTGANNSRLSEADSAVDSITVPIINWAKQINWTLFDLALASKSGNWDLVTSKERARKKNWDLGIQQIAFLGSEVNTNVKGLLTQSDVTANTSLLSNYIKTLNAADFETFCENVIETYRANCNRTAYPTHFIIPEADYNGLGVATDEAFPLKSKIERLLEIFRLITKNKNFEILPCAYADEANNATTSGLDKNRYTLLNYDEDSLNMHMPVAYNNTQQNTINGMQFQNVGYGQYSGVKAYRPLEMLYIDWAS